MYCSGTRTDDLFRLDSKTAVVTGASGKLGPVWIGALLDAGARVAGIDVLDPSAGPPSEITEILSRHGGEKRSVAQAIRGIRKFLGNAKCYNFVQNLAGAKKHGRYL